MTAPSVATASSRFDLQGCRAVVTGASRGIGAATAEALASSGADCVTLVARDQAALHTVAARVRRAGAGARIQVCDVTVSLQLAAAFEAAGEVDLLVNCAGANQPEMFEDVREETFERLWQLNVGATFFATQHAVARMRSHGRGGTIVNISSQMGHVGAPQRSVYCATKHAIEGMTKALAVELASDGIRVVSIAPTFIETELTAPFFADPAFRADVERRIPLGAIGHVDDVVGAVIFAASPAARLMTGTSLVVDGGWTAQ